MNIRLFTEEDIEKCVSLFIDVFTKEPWNDRWSDEVAKQYLLDIVETPGFIGVVAEKDDHHPVGVMFGNRNRWWSGDEFFIKEMFVDPSSQREGIGTKMFHYLERMLPKEGINRIVLLTSRGIPAEKFYHKNGFKEIVRIVYLSKQLRSQ